MSADNASPGKHAGRNERLWLFWMRIGAGCGCHQLPERSFFIGDYQFPVCARCAGVGISTLAALLVFPWYQLPVWCCFAGCAMMFADWLIQKLKIRESTNVRRFITGIIGGFCFMTLQLLAAGFLLQYIW